MINKNEIWSNVIKRLRGSISDSDFMTWFPKTTLRKIDHENAVIEVPNKFIARWLRDKYLKKIESSFRESVDLRPSIRFTYPKSQRPEKSPSFYDQSTLGLSNTLNTELNFDNFIVSDCNQFAYYSASEVADNPGGYYNPLYMFGNSGVGKTHILHALGNKINKYNPIARIKYISSDNFCNDFEIAKKSGSIDTFRSKFADLDCILLDDVQLVTGSIKPQDELVMLFDSYRESKTQMVIAGKFPPGQTPGLISSLKSRLEWGLLAEMRIPDEQTKRLFIDIKLKEEGITIPEDVLFFLVNSTNDLKVLDHYLIDIIGHSSLGKHREVNLSIVKSIIRSKKKDSIDIKEIQKTTARYFNISIANLISNEKRRDYSYPRQIAMYLCRKLIDLSYKDIGKKFGNKDHSTIIYAIKRIEQQKSKNKKVLNHLKDITALLT
jgi:chromosomal replication initiator protein